VSVWRDGKRSCQSGVAGGARTHFASDQGGETRRDFFFGAKVVRLLHMLRSPAPSELAPNGARLGELGLLLPRPVANPNP